MLRPIKVCMKIKYTLSKFNIFISSYVIRFAAKSSISSAASVEFEDNIQNLESVGCNIENILEINEGLQKSDVIIFIILQYVR